MYVCIPIIFLFFLLNVAFNNFFVSWILLQIVAFKFLFFILHVSAYNPTKFNFRYCVKQEITNNSIIQYNFKII